MIEFITRDMFYAIKDFHKFKISIIYRTVQRSTRSTIKSRIFDRFPEDFYGLNEGEKA